ncbi:MAG: M23 family metallopeptidase [Myxococcota bacterium]
MRSVAIYVAFFASLLIPPFLTWQLWRTTSRSVLDFTLRFLLLAASLSLIALAANWSLVGIWFMPLWITAFAVVFALRVLTARRLTIVSIDGLGSIAHVLPSVLGFGVIATLVSSAVFTAPYVGEPVALRFPLAQEGGRGGGWYVGQGGRSALVNAHANAPAQAYALDIHGLNALGMRAKGILPAELGAYAIYVRPVYAPCAGELLSVADGIEERSPPDSSPGPPVGNHVSIACQGATVLLAHLQPGSVLVEAGQRVEVGEPIGVVGNSGNTTEPHLHIHAVDGRVVDLQELIIDGTPRPLLFDGGFLHKHSSSVWPDWLRLL